jgi:hypothetical protein
MVWNATLSALPVGATAVFRHLHFGHIVSHWGWGWGWDEDKDCSKGNLHRLSCCCCPH